MNNFNLISTNISQIGIREKTFTFLIKLMECRDQLIINHWQTKSYAEHKWTDKLIKKLADIIDAIGEYTLGAYDRPMINITHNEITDINLKSSKSILDCLDAQSIEILQEYKILENEGMISLLGDLDVIIKKYKYLSTLQ